MVEWPDIGWSLWQIEDRFKLVGTTPIEGKANLWFGVKDGSIDLSAGMDAGIVKQQRPELYTLVNEFLGGSSAPASLAEDDDKYGDFARTRNKPLTQNQEYNRGVLNMRRAELEWAAKPGTPPRDWDIGARMLWAGVYKSKISDTELARVMAFILRRGKTVSLEALLQVERDFYSKKYAPKSFATLEAQLDLVAGEPDPTALQEVKQYDEFL